MEENKYSVKVFMGNRRWFWHVVAPNDQVLSVSQGYFSKFSAKRSARRIAKSTGSRLFVAGHEVKV